MKIKTDTYSWNFGIVIPQKTGIVWEQQTCGVLCNHVQIEGVYITLPKPVRYQAGNCRDLLEELQNGNYDFFGAERRRLLNGLWLLIKEEMFIKFKEVDSPKNQPHNQEGLQWIKVTGLKRKFGGYYLTNYDWKELKNSWKGLIGKTVALIYPNCD